VVSTHLKNMSQIGNLPQIEGENKNFLETTTRDCFLKVNISVTPIGAGLPLKQKKVKTFVTSHKFLVGSFI